MALPNRFIGFASRFSVERGRGRKLSRFDQFKDRPMGCQFVASNVSKALCWTMIWLNRIFTPHSRRQAKKRPNRSMGGCPSKHGLS